MSFKKSDLNYSDYSWITLSGDDPKISGKPDSTLFSRHEGYEMLYMIDKVLEHRNLTSVASGQKVESIIRTELPSTTRSQENVFNFVNKNW
ncbi:hypothetical protein [Gallaecimonas pentaromativorans]|uniref:hypothetical protein n=1 Tax=Gallaecimonas pentaromativorans TaxID=584787 RepID=UPI003A8F5894